MVLRGGRFTKPAESRYSPVEGEALAVVEGLQGTKDYILGMDDLIVATDHRPLLGVFERPLGEIDNPRLSNLVNKTLWYKFRMVHVPGKENHGPDYISRNFRPVFKELKKDGVPSVGRARAPSTEGDIKQRVVEVQAVMKGANRDKDKEHRPVTMSGEWCVKRAISTLNSREAAKEAGEVAHGGKFVQKEPKVD